MSKIKVCMCESFTTIVVKDWIEIDSEMYEETKGMSTEELQEYIEENYGTIKPTPNNNSEYIISLYDELCDQDVINDKIKNEETWLDFKVSDDCEDCDEFDIEEEEE